MKSVRKARFGDYVGTFVLCALFWLLLTWSFNLQELIAGALVSLAVSLFAARFFVHENGFWLLNPIRFLALLFYYIVVFFIELIKANVDVAFRALSPKLPIKPGIVKVPVGLKSEYGKASLADSITLTPGTITLDVAEEGDQTYFYIHWLNVTELDRTKAGDIIKGTLEKWCGRIWK